MPPQNHPQVGPVLAASEICENQMQVTISKEWFLGRVSLEEYCELHTNMIPKTIIHLLSGGLDSTVMLYDLQAQGHRIHCLLFNYHQKHAQELQWAIHHARRLGLLWTTIDLPELKGSALTDGSGGVVVPNRNAIFLSHAVALAVQSGADTVTYACNADDEEVFPDCRRAFVQSFNHLLMSTEIQVEVCAPYMDKRKWEIADLGRQLGVSFNETWSCYAGGTEPCGTCLACRVREDALSKVCA